MSSNRLSSPPAIDRDYSSNSCEKDVIYVVTYERSDYNQPRSFLSRGRYSNAFIISSNVLATISGDPGFCLDMLTHVKSRVDQDIAAGLSDAVDSAAAYSGEWITKWEGQNPNISFPSQTLIVGWSNGVPSAYDVQFAEKLPVTHQGDGFVHGSGKRFVNDYHQMEDPMPQKHGGAPRSDKELGQIEKRAAVYSALHNRYTGSKVRLVEVRRNMIYKSNTEEILEVLHDDYEKFNPHLPDFLLYLPEE